MKRYSHLWWWNYHATLMQNGFTAWEGFFFLFCSLKSFKCDTLIHLWWVRMQDLQLWCSKISSLLRSDSCINSGLIILWDLHTIHYPVLTITLYRHLKWEDWNVVKFQYCEMLNCCLWGCFNNCFKFSFSCVSVAP